MSKTKYEQLVDKLKEIEHLTSAIALHDWDTQVNMPPKGAKFRGEIIATLASQIHEKIVAKDFESLVLKLKQDLDDNKLDQAQSAVVREAYRTYSLETKLPSDFVKELSVATSSGHFIWVDAKKKNDFEAFVPQLTKIVELKREQAKLLGYKDSPYNALLDLFEPDLTVSEASIIFQELKDFLIPFIAKLASRKLHVTRESTKGNFNFAKQKELNELIARKIGYDFEAGRLDVAAHPFATGYHPHDVRITTRFHEDDLMSAVLATIHESGHGMYEQGLNPDHFGTPLGTSISLGIHESQSRIWENMVGKSMAFWKHFYPQLQQYFPEPFAKMSLEDFYVAINEVKPSLIRIESDEVTYNMHIIIRFEIEKELIEGSIGIQDLPKIWNAKYKEYLGVDVPSDSQGVLQDVHWSAGLFGYFPTYTLGNLYSGQFYQKAKSEVMNIEQLFEKGQFQPFLEWLRKHIHGHGKLYRASELVQQATGEPLNSKYYLDYLKEKFSRIYGI